MHQFAVLLFFAFGVMALTMVTERFTTGLPEGFALRSGAIGVGLAWLANFNLWTIWGYHARYAWVAVTLSGLALGGVSMTIHTMERAFHGLHRKLDDQAEVLEQRELRRVA